MRELFPAISDDAAELLTGLLTLNPQKRFTASEALAHRYFREQPRPTPQAALPKVGGKEKPQAPVRPQQDRGDRPSGRALNFDSP
jgi:serine/threonine protein kinase